MIVTKTTKIKFDSIEKGKRSIICSIFDHNGVWFDFRGANQGFMYICRRCGEKSKISEENLQKQ